MSTQSKNSDSNAVSGVCLFDLLFPDSEMRGWDWSRMPSDSETQQWNWKKDQQLSGPQKRLEDLLRQSGNKLCADCGSPDPKWVSLNLGVFICIKCSGVHRSLGVHISKVFSVKLDNWTDEQVNTFISMGGNADVNKKYEAGIIDLTRKPKPDSCIEERFEFIRRKYELLQFYNGNGHNSSDGSVNKRISPCSQINSSSKNGSQDKRQYEKLATRHRIANAFRNSRVKRDSDHKSFDKSNPSISRLASSVRTRVIKSNLNPVWNESLMLSIPEHIPPLKVLVYDKDTFSTDDFMGEAEIDIQPLVAATRAYEKSTIDESMQLGKWVASNDNTLVKDGIINLVDGKVRQDISLRLQNVERGVLEVELECIPLTQ
ncbi:probable ADP-ribosylation factor GTPase-activating protein AGD11 isoform X3 [Cucurbita pepo subsp. pepo]|uniref:probable ADP-ribosylation factor GTPase-activating protein AGD11 isoform X3 n=1 Tax=Cucurbita pepo subsp. pepo TaxID=3664 RepID=UPI000C9D5308|nr:probable ADP-ribosylation factor GTPase-activating protein AGD11 isoform X3 [Cucurbita pepo subsp. pepo]